MTLDSFKKSLNKNGPKIMIFGSFVLFGGAVIAALHSGRKIERIVRNGTEEGKSTNQIRKECAKELILPVGLTVAATALGVMGERKAEVRFANLATGYLAVKNELDTHKAVMEKILPPEQVEEVKQEIVNHKAVNSAYCSNTKATPVNYISCTGSGNQLWFDEKHRTWFRASPDAVKEALDTVNAELRANDWCSIAVLYQCLGLDYPKNDEAEGFVFRSGVNAYSEYANGVKLLDQYTEHPESHELAKVLVFDHDIENYDVVSVWG